MMEEYLEDLVCIYKMENIKSNNCKTCNGITDLCGYYENNNGLDLNEYMRTKYEKESNKR